MNEKMTKHDLDKLLQLDKNEVKALKHATEARRAQVVAQGEADIARLYKTDHKPEWAQLYKEASAIVQKLNARIRDDLEAEGKSVQFAPSADLHWSSRGENAESVRRAELRKVLVTESKAQQEAACVAIDLYSVRAQRELLTCGLETDIAREILAARPTLENLMPSLQLSDLEKKLEVRTSAIKDNDNLPWHQRAKGIL
ncbi:MAG: hypothetical protein QOG67_3060 [Verrucomicrobiota bacterium]|jgi:hypothetical protein